MVDVNNMTEEEYTQFLADNNVPLNVTANQLNQLHSGQKDGFGFNTPMKTPIQIENERLVKDHITVWNRLIENKGPLALKKDEIKWEGRADQLMNDESFRSFISAKTVKDKITVLRDAGLGTNKEMTDQELGQFLMTHAPSGLTEDQNVSEEAIEANESTKMRDMAIQAAATLAGGLAGGYLAGMPGMIAGSVGSAIGTMPRKKETV